MKLRILLLFSLMALLGQVFVGCKEQVEEAYDFNSPRILAHRGGRAEQEENTLNAFKATYNSGCHGFETDVHFDADKDFVIMHDFDLDRMTDGTGKIEASSTAYIKGLKTKEGNPVLFLDELLDFFAGCKTLYVEWEMKVNEEVYPEDLLNEYCEKLYQNIMSKKPADALYVFSSFDTRPLLKIKQAHPEAEVMLITGKPLTKEWVDSCLSLGIHRSACKLEGTSREAVAYAHDYDVKVNLWPGVKPEDTALAYYLGADYLCTDIPAETMKYIREHNLGICSAGAAQHPKKLVCMDLDGTLTQHKTPLTPEVKATLDSLGKKYQLLVVGGGTAARIHEQMNNYPIDILGNYGMEDARVVDGEWKIVHRQNVEVDKEDVLAKCQALREQYGHTDYAGESVEFHEDGMITFGLLGTKAAKEDKLAFDKDKKKRRAMYKDVCKAFPDYSVFIGGTTSFDMTPKEYNKYEAIMRYAEEKGIAKEEIIYFGDDSGRGGNDSHVRFGGIEFVRIDDYTSFPVMVKLHLQN